MTRPLGAHVRALRPQCWVRNAVVFAPLIFARPSQPAQAWLAALPAAAGFCLVASAVYLVNDLHDVHEDRAHPTKRARPVASGEIGKRDAGAMLAFLSLSILLWLLLFPALAPAFGAYVTIQLAYTFALRSLPVADLAAIGAGYAVREYAGASAAAFSAPVWLMASTALLVMFLAGTKRRCEASRGGPYRRPNLWFYRSPQSAPAIRRLGSSAVAAYACGVAFLQPAFLPSVPLVALAVRRYWSSTSGQTAGEVPEEVLLGDRWLMGLTLSIVAVCLAILFWGR